MHSLYSLRIINMRKQRQSNLVWALNKVFTQLLKEDAREHRRSEYLAKNRKLQERMWELQEIAEKNWRKHHYKADYEEVLYYVDSVCREMSTRKYHYLNTYWDLYVWMLNTELKKELSYCDRLVNVKKKITEK